MKRERERLPGKVKPDFGRYPLSKHLLGYAGRFTKSSVRATTRANDTSLIELHTLADCLQRGQHRAAVEKVVRFPWAHWRSMDGRMILVDRAYNPIWQRLRNGVVEPADPSEWIKIYDSEYLFDPTKRKPLWQHYESMKRLRAILVEWQLILPNRAERTAQWQAFLKRIRNKRKRAV
jgi:hypothetical protein